MGVALVEQPVPAWNIAAMARLRARLGTPPLLADECVFDAHDMLQVGAAAAADAVSLKLVKHGVLLGVRKVYVHPPTGLDPAEFDRIKAAEKAMALELQRQGTWVHLWRIAGQYANVSIFDVESHDALHDLLSKLPLFPFMTISVTPLARHPSALP